MSPHVTKCIFVGYDSQTKAYKTLQSLCEYDYDF